MGNAKIEFTIGGISFSGEGEDTWLATQLDKIIEKAPNLIKIAPLPQIDTGTTEDIITPDSAKEDATIAAHTLASYLKDKNALVNQERKFLATANWLQAKGNNRLVGKDVTKALNVSNQRRLGNPSRELGKNISKGFIDRDGQAFFVTDQGKATL